MKSTIMRLTLLMALCLTLEACAFGYRGYPAERRYYRETRQQQQQQNLQQHMQQSAPRTTIWVPL